jgi:diphthamide biosynthesis protein 3
MADDALSIYDEIEIEDMTFDPALQIYTFPCPCGDRFEIAIDDLRDGEEIAVCPSCSLMIRVIFDVVCLCYSPFPSCCGVVYEQVDWIVDGANIFCVGGSTQGG